MALQLLDLDARTRGHMLEELDLDLGAQNLYVSRYLSEAGSQAYPEMLRSAIAQGDDASLQVALTAPGVFHERYQRAKPKGGFTWAKVPHTAAMTLAEGEFNRFYLRGLCQRVIASGTGTIEVYRARESMNPRPESEAMIGTTLDPATLLIDLRTSAGVDTALGLPPGPNSGLSGRIRPAG